jgi:hypothetical protein
MPFVTSVSLHERILAGWERVWVAGSTEATLTKAHGAPKSGACYLTNDDR